MSHRKAKGLLRVRPIQAALVVAAVAAGVGQFVTSVASTEDVRDWLALREECLQLEEPEKLPACQEFLDLDNSDSSGPQEATAASLEIRFCDDAPSDLWPCDCLPNGLDVRCTFRICGYEKGHYTGSNLSLFVSQVVKEARSWGPRSVISTKFTGFADGTKWGSEKTPKPQPFSDFLRLCLERAEGQSLREMSHFSADDYLDAQLALLRGCALEEELAKSVSGFEFDSMPDFSFRTRQVGVSDPSARAAEFTVTVANKCGSLAHGRTN